MDGRPEPDAEPYIDFFTPRRWPVAHQGTVRESIYWGLVRQWRREGKQVPGGTRPDKTRQGAQFLSADRLRPVEYPAGLLDRLYSRRTWGGPEAQDCAETPP